MILSHFLINGDDTLVFPAMVVVNCCFTIIRSKYFCYTAKVFIHMDVRGNPGRLFFINRSLNIGILSVSHYANEKICVGNFAGIRIDDVGRIARPINFYLFTWFVVDVHRCTVFLLILLDLIAELGIHKRLIAGLAAFLKVFCPQKLFVDAIAEQFLSDISKIRHPFVSGRRCHLYFWK